jgi:hypothetical protein
MGNSRMFAKLGSSLTEFILTFTPFLDISSCRVTSKSWKRCVEFVFCWHQHPTPHSHRIYITSDSAISYFPSQISHIYIEDDCRILSASITHLLDLQFLRFPFDWVQLVDFPFAPRLQVICGFDVRRRTSDLSLLALSKLKQGSQIVAFHESLPFEHSAGSIATSEVYFAPYAIYGRDAFSAPHWVSIDKS